MIHKCLLILKRIILIVLIRIVFKICGYGIISFYLNKKYNKARKNNDVNIYEDYYEPINNFLKRHNMLNYKEKEIDIDSKYFEIPDYLQNKDDSFDNHDWLSSLVRRMLSI